MESYNRNIIFLTQNDLTDAVKNNDKPKTIYDYELLDFNISHKKIQKASEIYYIDHKNQIIKVLKRKLSLKETIYFNF